MGLLRTTSRDTGGGGEKALAPLALSSSSSSISSDGATQRTSSWKGKRKFINSIFRTFLNLLPIPLCKLKLALPSTASSHHALTSLSSPKPLGHFVTGTLYGHRKGHVYLAVQEDPKSHPVILLELATPTSALVKEMSSGLVRIALECERSNAPATSRVKLFQEPVWSMYCNGRKTGYAVRRICTSSDAHILRLVQTVSMGAGVLPMDGEITEGELMYMRARFERVIGSGDSEALYMMNPDGTGSPELSIFFLRI